MQPFPKWLSWIFVGFLAYIIYIGNQSGTPPASAPKEPAAAPVQREYESLRQLTDGDRWYRVLDPTYKGDADIKDINVGEGEAVACGSDVAVLVRGTTQDGANFDISHDESKPLKFRVGEAPIEALNEALIGMKQGGQRVLNAPANQVYTDPEKRTLKEITFNLTLQSFETNAAELPATSVTLVSGINEKEPARCGSAIDVELTVFDAQGKRLYKTEKPMTITLGSRALTQGVDLLARGMLIQEERLFHIPPHYLNPVKTPVAIPTALKTALSGNTLRIVHMTRVN